TPADLPAHLAEGSPAWKANHHTTAGLRPAEGLRSAADLRARYRTTNPGPATPDGAWQLPVHGAFNPGADDKAPTPGSFALAPDVGGPLMFASPDTPGMPPPSDKTAWDFLPDDWTVEILPGPAHAPCASSPCACEAHVFTDARGVTRRVTTPPGFSPAPQLEHAR